MLSSSLLLDGQDQIVRPAHLARIVRGVHGIVMRDAVGGQTDAVALNRGQGLVSGDDGDFASGTGQPRGKQTADRTRTIYRDAALMSFFHVVATEVGRQKEAGLR